MARMVSSSGFSRRSRPRISAPICLVRGTTSNRVRVSTVMGACSKVSAVVTVKLVGLAELLEHGFGAVHLVTVWILIVIAEQPEQRTAQLGGEIDGRDRPLGVELLGI